MINEKAKEQIEKQLAVFDRMHDLNDCDIEEEFELEDKPDRDYKYFPQFKISYCLTLGSLYSLQRDEGEKKAMQHAEENLEDVMHDLKEGLNARNYVYYYDCLGYAWACKDYVEGED